eukprot:1907012-Prymnesium_polylepis.1
MAAAKVEVKGAVQVAPLAGMTVVAHGDGCLHSERSSCASTLACSIGSKEIQQSLPSGCPTGMPCQKRLSYRLVQSLRAACGYAPLLLAPCC